MLVVATVQACESARLLFITTKQVALAERLQPLPEQVAVGRQSLAAQPLQLRFQLTHPRLGLLARRLFL